VAFSRSFAKIRKEKVWHALFAKSKYLSSPAQNASGLKIDNLPG
jgi:hypothetical protein